MYIYQFLDSKKQRGNEFETSDYDIVPKPKPIHPTPLGIYFIFHNRHQKIFT